MISHIFMLTATGDGIENPIQPALDAFYICEGRYDFGDVSSWNTDNEFHPVNLDKSYEKDQKMIESMKLRSRFQTTVGDGSLYHVKSETEIDRDTMEAVIQQKQKTGELSDFLKSAKL